MLLVSFLEPLLQFNLDGIIQFKDQLREYSSHKLVMLNITPHILFKLKPKVMVRLVLQLKEYMFSLQFPIKQEQMDQEFGLIQTKELLSMLNLKAMVKRKEEIKEPQSKVFTF